MISVFWLKTILSLFICFYFAMLYIFSCLLGTIDFSPIHSDEYSNRLEYSSYYEHAIDCSNQTGLLLLDWRFF